jgi:hypothetical protein
VVGRSHGLQAHSHPGKATREPTSHVETEAANEQDELAQRFEEVLEILSDLRLEQVWTEASDQERRVLLDELLDRIVVFPDHLEVAVHGAPKLNVLLGEIGLAESQNSRVGGGTRTLTPRAPAAGHFAIAA